MPSAGTAAEAGSEATAGSATVIASLDWFAVVTDPKADAFALRLND